MEFSSAHQMLKAEFDDRRKKNQRYSIRAFAMLLKMSSGRLHEILNGRHNVSLKMAHRFASRLNFDDEKTFLLLRLVESEIYLRADGRKRIKSSKTRLLMENDFSLIKEWEYFALMALVETSSFVSEVPWIAKKMAISEGRVSDVVNVLLSKDYLKIDENGKFKNTYSSMSTLIDVPSEIIRNANIECINQGVMNIHRIDVIHRDISSLTIPVDMQQIPAVKVLIREFKSKVTALMDPAKTTEVYNLNIQFIPVSELGV